MSPCMSQFVEGKHNMHNLTTVWSRRTRPAFMMLAPGKLFPNLAKFPESGGANVSRATPSFPPIRIANVPSGNLTLLLKMAIYSGFSHEKWMDLSIVMLNVSPHSKTQPIESSNWPRDGGN